MNLFFCKDYNYKVSFVDGNFGEYGNNASYEDIENVVKNSDEIEYEESYKKNFQFTLMCNGGAESRVYP